MKSCRWDTLHITITASDVRGEDRKRLIRELGRKPSEEKVSLYVRKPSNDSEEQKDQQKNTTTKKFMDSMARRSMEVPADFLDTISEEKNENKPTTGQQIAKKYPFNRTTTPNSLREHLKETLTKNLGGKFLSMPTKAEYC